MPPPNRRPLQSKGSVRPLQERFGNREWWSDPDPVPILRKAGATICSVGPPACESTGISLLLNSRGRSHPIPPAEGGMNFSTLNTRKRNVEVREIGRRKRCGLRCAACVRVCVLESWMCVCIVLCCVALWGRLKTCFGSPPPPLCSFQLSSLPALLERPDDAL